MVDDFNASSLVSGGSRWRNGKATEGLFMDYAWMVADWVAWAALALIVPAALLFSVALFLERVRCKRQLRNGKGQR